MSVQVKRRDFLKIAGVSAGTAAVAAGLKSQNALARPALPALAAPVAPADRNKIWHLLNRTTFGLRPGQIEAVNQQGIDAYLNQQLNPASINDAAMDQRLGKYMTLNLSAAEIFALKNNGNSDQEVVRATIERGIYSERQLYEVMVLFWSEHFSIQQGKSACYVLKTVDDRDVVRKHALGKFRDLLLASAQSPAMLNYLDNDISNKAHPNENYAREVMELHTLGVGNYTEQDIKELARCLTGWSWYRGDPKEANHDKFAFFAGDHDTGPKTVLGQQVAAGGGMQDALTILTYLANHPITAKRISLKLCRRFIGDTPSDATVSQVAAVFQQTDGDIPSVLKAIFASQEFWSAPPKYKRPHEYILSLFRVFNIQSVTDWGRPTYDLELLGQRPFAHATPDGYSDFSSVWMAGNLMDRWNRGIGYTDEKAYNDKNEDLFQLAQKNGAADTVQGVLDFYAQLMLGHSLSAQEQTIVGNFMTSAGGAADLKAGRGTVINTLALFATSPAFQYR